MTAEPGNLQSTATAQPRRCDDDRLAPSRTNGQSLPGDVGDILLAPPARSVYRGISYDPVSNMWRARMYYSRKHVTLGRFSSAQEAAFVHDRAAYYIHGDAAKTNFGLDAARDSNKREHPSGSWSVMSTLDALAKEVKLIRVQEERSDGGSGSGNVGGNGGIATGQGARAVAIDSRGLTLPAAAAAAGAWWAVPHCKPQHRQRRKNDQQMHLSHQQPTCNDTKMTCPYLVPSAVCALIAISRRSFGDGSRGDQVQTVKPAE
jgi:hypothetical protein